MSAILGVSFGSLATLFTKDAEVLGIVKTGVLVCSTLMIDNLFDLYSFTSLHKRWCPCIYLMISKFSQFVSASQPLNALAYIFDGLHYGISDFPYAAGSMVNLAIANSKFFEMSLLGCTCL